MSLSWKTLRPVALIVLLPLGSGCSGIQASKSVSPLDFLLPGLGSGLKFLQNAPRSPEATPVLVVTARTNQPLLSVQAQ